MYMCTHAWSWCYTRGPYQRVAIHCRVLPSPISSLCHKNWIKVLRTVATQSSYTLSFQVHVRTLELHPVQRSPSFQWHTHRGRPHPLSGEVGGVCSGEDQPQRQPTGALLGYATSTLYIYVEAHWLSTCMNNRMYHFQRSDRNSSTVWLLSYVLGRMYLMFWVWSWHYQSIGEVRVMQRLCWRGWWTLWHNTW
jgi:hypothetical protein